jgi:hypothetical protein
VLLARISGVFDSSDLDSLDRAVIAFSARHGPSHGLLDFTAVDAFALAVGKLAWRAVQPPINRGYQRVIVVPQPELHALAKDFAAQQVTMGSTGPKVVSTVDEALALLGLSDPAFEPADP